MTPAPGTAPQTRPVYLGAGNSEFMTLDVVVHEQAYQWYGNAVADEGEEGSCLSECLASYSTWLWDEEKDGVDLDSGYREQVEEHKDDADWWQRLYQPGKPPGITVYNKGPLALHALRHQVGDDTFHRILTEWPQKRRGTYAVIFIERPALQARLLGLWTAGHRVCFVPAEPQPSAGVRLRRPAYD